MSKRSREYKAKCKRNNFLQQKVVDPFPLIKTKKEMSLSGWKKLSRDLNKFYKFLYKRDAKFGTHCSLHSIKTDYNVVFDN